MQVKHLSIVGEKEAGSWQHLYFSGWNEANSEPSEC